MKDNIKLTKCGRGFSCFDVGGDEVIMESPSTKILFNGHIKHASNEEVRAKLLAWLGLDGGLERKS